jgi:hypothetical protein
MTVTIRNGNNLNADILYIYRMLASVAESGRGIAYRNSMSMTSTVGAMPTDKMTRCDRQWAFSSGGPIIIGDDIRGFGAGDTNFSRSR